ncbi:MAG TPA: chemotaxis protein CheW [Cytophagaceae bacterium]|jgi:purine-binding chemotaxis protein CheW
MEEVTENRKVVKPDSNSPLISLIVFKLGGEEYGIRIEQVKEVTITPAITKMPKTAAFIRGVANIRGDIIAIMDLEERFKIQSDSNVGDKRHSYTLVVERQNYSIGLVVKEVPQTLTLSVSEIDKTPNILQDLNINEKYIDGIGKVDKRLIIILDIYKILTFEEEQQLIKQ